MQTKIVKSSELGNDWRAEKHVEPSKELLEEARIAGCECGLRGTQFPPRRWVNHGSKAVQEVFNKAFKKGWRARQKAIR